MNLYCEGCNGIHRSPITDCGYKAFDANDKQQAPVPNDGPDIFKLVMEDISQRAKEGKVKYGTTLQPYNGRDAVLDAYQEVLDLAQYLRQRIYEERGV